MKIITIVISVLALVLIAFNVTQINFESPFEGQSVIALITILSGLCALTLMLILRISIRIEEKTKDRN